MAAGKWSFVIEQGATFQRELQYLDCNSVPIDLTYYSAKMQLRDAPGSTTLYLTLSSSIAPDGSGINLNGLDGSKPGASGSIGIIISAVSSSLLSFDEAYYDLELYSGSFVDRLVEGKVKLSKQVTTDV
jgi:hypothetical protein